MSRGQQFPWELNGSQAVARATDPDLFIAQYIAPLFIQTVDAPLAASLLSFDSEELFWRNSHDLLLGAIQLISFRISDWFPRAPGVYWSRRGRQARQNAWSGPTRKDATLGTYYSPESKWALIEEGGIGTIRLCPRRIDGDICWLATAFSGLSCQGGVPLAIPDSLWRRSGVNWGDYVTIEGRVRLLQDAGLADTAASVHHARPLIIFVEKLNGVAAGAVEVEVISPVALFQNTRTIDDDYSHPLGYTFVQCTARSDPELDDAADWITKYAEKHSGTVITNFDEQRPALANAPLSYQRLVAKTFDRVVIEQFAGPVIAHKVEHLHHEEHTVINVKLGNGNIIQGDFVVAKSIEGSFNRVKKSAVQDDVKTLLLQLASQVGTMAAVMEKDHAAKAADDLERLTQEATRPRPSRSFWELSVKGLKDAATTVKDIGAPILSTVAKLIPLLAAMSA